GARAAAGVLRRLLDSSSRGDCCGGRTDRDLPVSLRRGHGPVGSAPRLSGGAVRRPRPPAASRRRPPGRNLGHPPGGAGGPGREPPRRGSERGRRRRPGLRCLGRGRPRRRSGGRSRRRSLLGAAAGLRACPARLERPWRRGV
ncbi:MAG: hypothetical protein AVDCRST_MAG59-1938, partial [uncultured Thermomicrobiales bacterium]